jgi:hypothetical protein
VGVLAPGESVTATASYVVTAADGAPGSSPTRERDRHLAHRRPRRRHGLRLDRDHTAAEHGWDLRSAMPIGATLMILVGLGVFLASRRKKETA